MDGLVLSHPTPPQPPLIAIHLPPPPGHASSIVHPHIDRTCARGLDIQATAALLLKLSNKQILPVQRCMRYCMLLQQVLTKSEIRVAVGSTSADINPTVKSIVKAYELSKQFAAFCNTEELQGQSQILLAESPKLRQHIDGATLMLCDDVCKGKKNARRVWVYLFNNGVLVEKAEVS
jgi:hypothetical protein